MDKMIICADCGKSFVFTEGEMEFYNLRGFNTLPQRCKACRDERRSHSLTNKKRYEIVCVRCGAVDLVPFEPTHDRPVYCNKCYHEIAARS